MQMVIKFGPERLNEGHYDFLTLKKVKLLKKLMRACIQV